MYNALRTAPKGKSEPLCKLVSDEITASYTSVQADIILGTCDVYTVLRDTYYAMCGLECYTTKQTGTYNTLNRTTKEKVSETYACTVSSDLSTLSSAYDVSLTTKIGSKKSTMQQMLYADPSVMILVTDENGTKSAETAANIGEDIAFDYAAVHALFAPDQQFVTAFDCTETADSYILTGYSNRYDLLYDITSEESTNYYYDMKLTIDKDTMYLRSAELTYTDQWITADGETMDIDYHVTFQFYDFNASASKEAIIKTQNALNIGIETEA